MVKDAHTEERLLAAIRAVSGSPDAAWARKPKRILGGSWADIFRVRLRGLPGIDGELVARVLPTPDSFEREMLVQQHVAKQGFPAPRVHLGSLPTKEFDRAWILMDFDPGRRLISGTSGIQLTGMMLKSLRESPRMLADVAVAIHAIDAEPIAKTLAFPKVVGPVLDWLYSRASALGDADLVERAQRLLRDRPAYRGSELCHGDLHPLNILRSPDRDTIIDWTHAQYDDPLYDVAFTTVAMRVAPIRASRALRPLIAAVGAHEARRFIREYERASGEGVDESRLVCFTRLVALRIRVEAAEWPRVRAHAQGVNGARAYVDLFPRYGL